MKPEIAIKNSRFFAHYPARRYKKGQILIHMGDQPDGIYYIVSGKVKQYQLTDRGDEVVLNVFKEPAFIPMSYAINRKTNDYFFEADSDVEVRKAPLDEVINFLQTNTDILFDLLSRVYRGTDGLLQRMAHLMASTAKSRVLYELIVECHRFATSTKAGFTISINESEIGARAGLSRETVSREMRKLADEGLINVLGKRITIPNLMRIEQSLSKDQQWSSHS